MTQYLDAVLNGKERLSDEELDKTKWHQIEELKKIRGVKK